MAEAVAIPAPIDAVVAAINGGDTDAFLDAFTADGLVDDWGNAYRGRDEIAAWNARELIGAKGRLTVTRAQRRGDIVSVVGDWKRSFFSGPSRMVFTVEGDKIREMRITSG
ncbi:MAG: nuclear transport factor 2 family protein [Bauldia sp.]